MHARLVPLPRVTAVDVRAWRRLADAAVEPNLYLDPRFLVPARHRGREVDDVRLLVVEEGGEWLALLALTTTTVAPGVPVRAVTTGGTFMTTHSDRHHPLVRVGREVDALGALLGGLREVGLPGLVQLQHFPVDGPLADALGRVVARGGMLVHERRRTSSAYAPRSASSRSSGWCRCSGRPTPSTTPAPASAWPARAPRTGAAPTASAATCCPS